MLGSFLLQVNKSLQDRLRRDRISRSVEELRDLVLGPSGVHVSADAWLRMLKMGGIKIIKIKWGLYIVNYSMLLMGV